MNKTVGLGELRDPKNYKPLNKTVRDSTLQHIAGSSIISQTRSLLRPNANGSYFGFHDTGTCGAIERVVVYYTVCLSKQVELVFYPEFANPPHNGPDQVVKAECVCNAHNVTTLNVLASASDGTCVDEAVGGARCECDDGYEIAQDRSSCNGK